MSAGMLLKGEYLKAITRLAFAATTVLVVGTALIHNGMEWYLARAYPDQSRFAFPDAWINILREPMQMSTILITIAIMLLVGSEFTWRTARQNVIDGLSKNQWFASKLLLALVLCAFYEVLVIAIGVAFAATNPFTTFIKASHALALAGATVGLLGFGAVGLFLAITVRNAGGALAVLFLWLSVAEPAITLLVKKLNKAWEPATDFLPIRVFGSMLEPQRWDAAMMQQTVDAATKAGRRAPELHSMGLMTTWAVGYIALFIGIAYWNFRKRDL